LLSKAINRKSLNRITAFQRLEHELTLLKV
jgi:hypothetical protein